jgi:rubrerythrin
MEDTMNKKQVEELVLQSLEHELGGARIYETALKCALNHDLKEEWEKYLDETRTHAEKLRAVCAAMSIDPAQETPGRAVVRHVGQSLEQAMRMALAVGDRKAAELVAGECVVLAETKDHLDWELLRRCAEELDGSKGSEVLREATEQIEDQEDQHLYHTRGFCRELWIDSLGMKAVLPPPEERRQVKTAIGAARAEKAADLERE